MFKKIVSSFVVVSGVVCLGSSWYHHMMRVNSRGYRNRLYREEY